MPRHSHLEESLSDRYQVQASGVATVKQQKVAVNNVQAGLRYNRLGSSRCLDGTASQRLEVRFNIAASDPGSIYFSAIIVRRLA
jgi:hypothetical protein